MKKLFSLSSVFLLFWLNQSFSAAAPSFSVDLENPQHTLAVSSYGTVKVNYTIHNHTGAKLAGLSFRTSPVSQIDPVGTTCKADLDKGKTCQVRLDIGPVKEKGQLDLSPLTVCVFKGASCVAADSLHRVHVKFGKTPLAYVLLTGNSDNVKVIDTSTQKVVKKMTVPAAVKDIAISSDSTCAYVTVPSEKGVRMINLVNDVNAVSKKPIELGSTAAKANLIRMTPDGRQACVSGGVDSNKDGMLNLMTNKPAPQVTNNLTATLKDFLLTSAGYTYVAGPRAFGVLNKAGTKLVSVANAVVEKMALLPQAQLIYAAVSGGDGSDNKLLVVRAKDHSVAATIPLGAKPLYVAASPDAHRVYALVAGPKLLIIDIKHDNKIIGKVDLPTAGASVPYSLAVTPDSQSIYVVCKDGVRVIDAQKEVVSNPIEVSGNPTGSIAMSA